jgi:hypothetical protein
MNLLERRLADQTALPDLTLLSRFAPVQGMLLFAKHLLIAARTVLVFSSDLRQMSGSPRLVDPATFPARSSEVLRPPPADSAESASGILAAG